MNKNKNQKDRCSLKGSIAVFTLFLMFILTVVTISIITTAATERRTSISTGNSTTAFQIAESGMERTLQFFKSDFDEKIEDIYPGHCEVKTVDEKDAATVEYDVNNIIRFKDNADIPVYITACDKPISEVKIIKSIGTTKQETRAIEQDVSLGATKLLLHLNGATEVGETYYTEDSSYYYDKYINNVELKGDAETETTATLTEYPENLGEGVAKLDGDGDYIYIPNFNDGDWDFGSGNFTIDFWIRTTALNADSRYIEIGSETNALSIYQKNSDICFAIESYEFCKPFSPSVDTWEHIAFVRKEGDVSFFINGEKTESGDYSSEITITDGGIFIGSSSQPDKFFEGYVDELRISKGVARWWEDDFTPPIIEYWPD